MLGCNQANVFQILYPLQTLYPLHPARLVSEKKARGESDMLSTNETPPRHTHKVSVETTWKTQTSSFYPIPFTLLPVVVSDKRYWQVKTVTNTQWEWRYMLHLCMAKPHGRAEIPSRKAGINRMKILNPYLHSTLM